MLGNFLIGLREGLEASLVVGILVAYLVRTGARHRLSAVWTGVGTAVALSVAVGALLTFTSATLSGAQQEAFAGATSIVAVGFVTWMVFWMRRTARTLRGELQGKMEHALALGGTALAVTAFLAVGREGLETAVFVWSAVQATGEGAAPIVGAALGLGTAVVLGWLVYRRSVALNLATFFRVTGAGLIVVAAGVLGYGVHDLQEANVLPGLDNLAFDVSTSIPLSSWYGSVLHGVFGFTPQTSWLQLAAYLLYAIPVLILFFRPAGARQPVPVAG